MPCIVDDVSDISHTTSKQLQHVNCASTCLIAAQPIIQHPQCSCALWSSALQIVWVSNFEGPPLSQPLTAASTVMLPCHQLSQPTGRLQHQLICMSDRTSQGKHASTRCCLSGNVQDTGSTGCCTAPQLLAVGVTPLHLNRPTFSNLMPPSTRHTRHHLLSHLASDRVWQPHQ